ncbi:MAG: GNAT family N-acetyltransferase [Rhodopseudomonas sp.]|uniref:acyl-homoserine-lactone synthase n=1 Tax=Rhodopseudomonas sp. TaxID=1078 RepID=UPI0017C7B358|nr:acyl-homoserine-lactone synthase [Rhodopseudomonas sp.]NVN88194.1 GNAT family N-acetyltransferase [Rhodopseudomonas sp.]
MIRIVNNDNRARYAKSMDQHFRMRHKIFVQERGWKEFERGTIETDEFDTEHAVYGLAIDRQDDVVGCFRLYPTTLPHMMSEHFAWMVDGPVPQRSDLLEASRYSIMEGRRDSRTYQELFLGIVEYCLSQGITGATALARTLRVPILQSIGMIVRPLGLPADIAGESNVAVLMETSEESLARIRKNAGVIGSVLESTEAVSHRVA